MRDSSPWIKLEWGTGDAIANPFPAICCQCLKPTHRRYRMLRKTMRPRFGPAFYVPFCSTCQKALDRKRNVLGIIVLLAIVVGCVMIFQMIERPRDRFGAIIALVGISLLPTVLVMQFWVEPFQCLNSRIRFRNPKFTRQWQDMLGKPMDFILPQAGQMRENRDEDLP